MSHSLPAILLCRYTTFYAFVGNLVIYKVFGTDSCWNVPHIMPTPFIQPGYYDRTAVEKVERFKFLGVHINDKLKWSTHTDSVVKKAQQRLFNLRRLKKCSLSPKTLTNFYKCTIESSLSGCITAWYDNCTAHNRRALQRVVRSAQLTTTCPPGHLQHPMSQEGQKDHQGQQSPEPLPVHPVILQKARSVHVHESLERETEK